MKLPLDSFEVIDSQEELAKLDFSKMTPDDSHGYFVVADWHYPEHLHKLHQDLPLIPDLETIDFEKLSPYCKMMLTMGYPHLNPENYKQTKLVCTFEDKTFHMAHYLNCCQYLRHGLVLKKIHYAVKFRQAAFVKDYSQCVQRGSLYSNDTHSISRRRLP